MAAAIAISGLTKTFAAGVTALEEINLVIDDGEFFALLGPSGCGKTTLLRTVAGLEVPTRGTISIGGRDVTRLPPGPRRVAMVFQDYALYPHMDVADNIAYPLKVHGMDKQERRAKAAETGSHLGLEKLMDRWPGKLSGGQQQRVAVARALAADADVLLFDEPLSNLDARLRMEARTFLKRLHADLKRTTVYVTHDQSEALALADRMAVMEAGVVQQVGTPSEVFHRPANLFVAQFIGSTPMNIIPGTVTGGRIRVGPHELPCPAGAGGGVAEGEEVLLAARPEYLELRPADDETAGVDAEVAIIEDLGTQLLVSLDGPGGSMRVVVGENQAPKRGERVRVVGDWSRALVYRSDTGKIVTARGHDEDGAAPPSPPQAATSPGAATPRA